ncbi:oligosaccharide repeat unit polymerase [Pedobacter sp. SYP-B3415]|uniref:oligosaccharide repeat unit polymerase n=1 Tax=Pedobacter sp. SYP-B3415 TaxID=2496641 RepID=UPI00272D8C7A|nr:oligosaccharide repeat unit polymerase [Pedobacter sp. SYP-B3415]
MLRIESRQFKVKAIFVLISLTFFFSKLPFFQYAIANPSVGTWFLYRFVDLQGRDPFFRILSTGAEVYFYLFSFMLIFLLKTWRKRALILVILALLIGVMSGGRSSVLGGLLYLGTFIFYFNKYFKRKFIQRVNHIGVILVVASLSLAAVISSLYEADASVTDGFKILVNRFIAVGDGLEYYMLYNGPEKIPSGPGQYFLAVFGVYVKGFTNLEYKNVGTQLVELVVGDVSFAQGSNFVFPLQAVVLGRYAWIFYVPLMALTVCWLRRSRSRSFVFLPLSFFFCYHCFTIATDIEYGLLCFISGMLVYFIIIFPVLKLKL